MEKLKPTLTMDDPWDILVNQAKQLGWKVSKADLSWIPRPEAYTNRDSDGNLRREYCGCDGLCQTRERSILIDESLSETEAISALAHELGHVDNFDSEELAWKTGEKFIDQFGDELKYFYQQEKEARGWD